jgi:hypothetical protein
VDEMVAVLPTLGLQGEVEDKKYARDWLTAGRLRVELNDTYGTRRTVMEAIGLAIRQSVGRKMRNGKPIPREDPYKKAAATAAEMGMGMDPTRGMMSKKAAKKAMKGRK